jgi:mannose-6-phosphate isomerase-like protein (cupin superfamily)
MMQIQNFIQSGILEEYCLGLLSSEEQAFVIQMSMLYPEIKEELTQIELIMEKAALKLAVKPNPELKQTIFNSLTYAAVTNSIYLNNLPDIDSDTNYQDWLEVLAHLIPVEPLGDISFQLLRQDNRVTQTLVISRIDVPEEMHKDVIESFLILKGECECTVGDDVVSLGPGGFIEIPLFKDHDVKIISPYVVAVLQHAAL